MTTQNVCDCKVPEEGKFEITNGPNGLGLIASLNGAQMGNHSVIVEIHECISFCHLCKRYVIGDSVINYKLDVYGLERFDDTGLHWKFTGRMWIPSLPDEPMADKELHRVHGTYGTANRIGFLFGDGVIRS